MMLAVSYRKELYTGYVSRNYVITESEVVITDMEDRTIDLQEAEKR